MLEKIYEVRDIRNAFTRMTCKIYKAYRLARLPGSTILPRLSKVSGYRVLQKTFSSFGASSLQNIGDFQFKEASLARLSRLFGFPKPSGVYRVQSGWNSDNFGKRGIVSKLRIERPTLFVAFTWLVFFNIYAWNKEIRRKMCRQTIRVR